jgi:hypothetical protein
MNGSEKFNEFVSQNGGSKTNMDENMILQYEDKKERVYWASVYGSEVRKVPKGFFTSQNVYRDFCVAVAGMMPKKRRGEDFDEYIRERLVTAAIRETSPGLEEGALVAHAIFTVLDRSRRHMCNYDDPERKIRDVGRGNPAFLETRPEGPGCLEIFVRVNNLLDFIAGLYGIIHFERKITREEVVEWLEQHGRKPYPATGVSPRRLRSTYPIPYRLYDDWRAVDVEEDAVLESTLSALK